MRISIFGMGYVGVVSGACIAKLGHHVIGVDVNSNKVKLLNKGRAPIVEQGINELVAEMVAAGRLSATTNATDAVAQSEVSFVSVGTPSARNGACRLDAIDAVSQQIGDALKNTDRKHTVAVRSTAPPGTIEERVVPIIRRASGRESDENISFCSNPEFLREGSAIADFQHPSFTLAGCTNPNGFATIEEIYGTLNAPIINVSIRTAESIKYLCNIFHALKITFANEVGATLKSMGVDSREAMQVFCEDHILNISKAYLRPGFAFGGSCLPKDIRAFQALAQAQGVDLPVIASLLNSNSKHIERAFEIVTKTGRQKIALFGLAFKPGTDDLRESPLVVLAERLIGKGFELAIYDRHVDTARLVGANREFIDHEIPHIERLLKSTPEETLQGAGVIVVGHAGPEEIQAICATHAGRTIVDLQGVKAMEALPSGNYNGICW